MTIRNLVLTILLAAWSSPDSVAQFMGSGGVGGFGGMGGASGLGSSGPPRERSAKAKWRPWLAVAGTYLDNPIYIDDLGNVVTAVDTRGASGSWGISGQKSLENTFISMGYAGNALINGSGGGVRGTSHFFTAGVSHRFNKSLYASVQHMMGSSLGGYGVGSGFAGVGGSLWNFGSYRSSPQSGLLGVGDPANNGFVDEEAFANRVNFMGTFGTVGYQLSMRSSLLFSGGAQFTRRNQPTLGDSNSYYGAAAYVYALDRNTDIAFSYTLGGYKYPNRFGSNLVQSAGVSIGRRFRDNAGIMGGIGVSQFNSEFVGEIVVDPDIADLLGIASVTTVQKAQRRTLSGGISTYYRSDIANFHATAQRGMVPGNGVLYGGIRDSAIIGISRSLVDTKLSAGLNGSISRVSGVIQPEVQTRYQASAVLGYSIGRGVFMNVNGGLRWQRLSQNGPYLPQKYLSVGIGWSPAGYPLFF